MALKANEVSLRLARGGWARYGFNNHSGGYLGLKSASKSHKKNHRKRVSKKRLVLSPRVPTGSSKRGPGGQIGAKRLPKELPKSVDPRSDVLQTLLGGEVYLPPYPPPLDPLAGQTPKNDQGSDPNSKKNMTARFARVLWLLRSLWLPFGNILNQGPDPNREIAENRLGSRPYSKSGAKLIRVATLIRNHPEMIRVATLIPKGSKMD